MNFIFVFFVSLLYTFIGEILSEPHTGELAVHLVSPSVCNVSSGTCSNSHIHNSFMQIVQNYHMCLRSPAVFIH